MILGKELRTSVLELWFAYRKPQGGPVPLPTTKRVLVLSALALVGLFTSVVGQLAVADSLEDIQRERAKFLCTWKKTHGEENPRPLEFCENPELGMWDLREQVKEWWGYYAERDERHAYSLETTFDSDWSAFQQHRNSVLQEAEVAAANIAAQKRAAKMAEKSRMAAAEREAKFNQAVGRMSTDEICQVYSQTPYSSARAELLRRNALSAADWSLVDRRKIAIGMSQNALFCSWGSPARRNRTVTIGSEFIQYIYGDTFVYVANGIVTSFQDSR